MKEEILWKGRPVLHKDHCFDLDRESAIHEFKNGLSKDQAEETAYQAYKRTGSLDAAAYHLVGMATAKAAGNKEEAMKHGIAYGLHAKILGLNPVSEPPPEVTERMGKFSNVYGFKPHNADLLFAQPSDQELSSKE